MSAKPRLFRGTEPPILREFAWHTLLHAYGRATDTPRHLLALLAPDARARSAALSHLHSAVLHQGTPGTATGPVARVIAAMLAESPVDPVRGPLLAFLTDVIEAPQRAARPAAKHVDLDALLDAGDDDAIYDDASNALYVRSLDGCAAVTPYLVPPIVASLDHADAAVRTRAAWAAVALAHAGAVDPAELAARLHAMADRAPTADERSALVLSLGDLGAPTAAFLTDPAPAVRLCAALSDRSDAATAELLGALEHHAADLDTWWRDKPPSLRMRPRFLVVARAIDRVRGDFERLAPAAIAVAAVAGRYTVDVEWGPLLAAAFAAAFPAGKSRATLTDAQRRFLAALVANADLWDPRAGNVSLWFDRVGLPHDRDAIARLTRPDTSRTPRS